MDTIYHPDALKERVETGKDKKRERCDGKHHTSYRPCSIHISLAVWKEVLFDEKTSLRELLLLETNQCCLLGFIVKILFVFIYLPTTTTVLTNYQIPNNNSSPASLFIELPENLSAV